LNVVATDEQRPCDDVRIISRREKRMHTMMLNAKLIYMDCPLGNFKDKMPAFTHSCEVAELALEGGDVSQRLELLVILVLEVSDAARLAIRHASGEGTKGEESKKSPEQKSRHRELAQFDLKSVIEK
jgi:hypothetical protein